MTILNTDQLLRKAEELADEALKHGEAPELLITAAQVYATIALARATIHGGAR
ncbi:MAG: hypothetical protein ACRD2A_02645 [Vicinamibacterales bacterium]